MNKKTTLAALICASLSPCVLAQSIEGTVKTQSGKLVKDATVELEAQVHLPKPKATSDLSSMYFTTRLIIITTKATPAFLPKAVTVMNYQCSFFRLITLYYMDLRQS